MQKHIQLAIEYTDLNLVSNPPNKMFLQKQSQTRPAAHRCVTRVFCFPGWFATDGLLMKGWIDGQPKKIYRTDGQENAGRNPTGTDGIGRRKSILTHRLHYSGCIRMNGKASWIWPKACYSRISKTTILSIPNGCLASWARIGVMGIVLI